MYLRCVKARIPWKSLLKTRCSTIRPVRFYQGFGGRNGGYRNDRKPPLHPGNRPVRNFPRAKLIEVPFEANAPEVTVGQLKDNGLLARDLHDSVLQMGFERLTAVQQKAIGPILENKSQDVITRAKTGTGKTFAFLIPMFQHLINTKRENPSAVKYVIVAPTRDLALQIETETKRIQNTHPTLRRFRSLTLVGGTNFGSGVNNLVRRKPQIVIATPGRLLDVLNSYDKYFKQVNVKVLDEADRLLEIGFQQDLEKISKILNEINESGSNHIRTLLFSATLDAKVQDLSQSIMGKDECLFLDTVDKNEPQAHEKIYQSAVISQNLGHCILATMDHVKNQILENPNYKVILFTPTIKFTTLVSELLHDRIGRNIPVLEFHGKKNQIARTKMVQKFKHDASGILVCTDVAARGLDFPDVKEVLQIGVPAMLPQYIHRIGRTARAGKTGKAVLFMSEGEVPFLQRLAEEAHIVIRDQTDYEPSVDAVKEFASQFDDHEKLVDTFISTIAYYRTNARGYGLNDNTILEQIAESYGILLDDKDAKLPVSASMLERLGLANNRTALRTLEVHGLSRGKPRDKDAQSDTYKRPRERRWYDEKPFQSFVKKGKLKNRNFNNKSYDRKKGHNPRFEE